MANQFNQVGPSLETVFATANSVKMIAKDEHIRVLCGY